MNDSNEKEINSNVNKILIVSAAVQILTIIVLIVGIIKVY